MSQEIFDDGLYCSGDGLATDLHGDGEAERSGAGRSDLVRHSLARHLALKQILEIYNG